MINIYNNKISIKFWLDKMKITNYTINEDLTVDVNGSFFLSDKNLKTLPITFNYVKNTFYCQNNELTDLKGFPCEVGELYFYNNPIINLDNLPQIVKGYFVLDLPHNEEEFKKLTKMKHFNEVSFRFNIDNKPQWLDKINKKQYRYTDDSISKEEMTIDFTFKEYHDAVQELQITQERKLLEQTTQEVQTNSVKKLKI
jgi:hypothetical protein